MAEPPTLDVGISITRVFDAPRERVWKEWTEPEPFADWFGGGEAEVPLSSVSMDVRPGGSWRATMFATRGAARSTGRASFARWSSPSASSSHSPTSPGDEAYELVTVVLTDLGDGRTEMHFQQRGSLPAEVYERAKEGWSTFFDRIVERLAAA